MRRRSEENPMKKFCALLALVFSLAFAGTTLAQDKPAATPDEPAAAEVKKEEAKPPSSRPSPRSTRVIRRGCSSLQLSSS
jgi:hypothetical protein